MRPWKITAACSVALPALFAAALNTQVSFAERLGNCQCTDYVYSRRADLPQSMGMAKNWLASARVLRLPYDQVPQVGDVVVFLQGEYGFSAEYGHVAIVIWVNESRDRFDIAGWDGLKADCVLEIYHSLAVTDNTFFIHRKFADIELPLFEPWNEQDGDGTRGSPSAI
ncbi:MAG TPA: CHAP domain-containing protein [Anaerolineales bacterium]|nr:CHAP domain-containing protein [Anaerolineales bacterium]